MSFSGTSAATDRKVAKAKLLAIHQALAEWEDRFAQAGVLCVIAGFFGMLYEACRWLQSGVWDPYRTWPLGRAVIDNSWLDAPTSWR